MTKEEAIEWIRQICAYLTSGNPVWRNEPIIEACDIAIKAIETEPVKHGRWRVTHELESWDTVYCSECGEGMWNAKGDNLPNYCYNCGAKMDEVTE